MKSFGKSVIETGIANLFIALFGFGTGIFLARFLGPYGRGELAAIQNWATLLATLSLLGMGESVVYFSAKSPAKIGQYIITSLVIALISALFFIGIGYLILPSLLAAQSPEIITAARNYLPIILLFTLFIIPIQSLRGSNKITVWNLLRFLQMITWLLVLIFAYLNKKPSSIWISKQYFLITLLFTVVSVITVFSLTPGPFRINLKNSKEILLFGLPAFGGVIPQLLNLRLDQMLMAAFLSPSFLGLYAIAVSWSSILGPIFSAIGSITFPNIAATASLSDKLSKLTRSCHLGVIVILILGPLAAIITPFAIPALFGREYVSSVSTAVILIIAACVTGINNILEEGVKGLGKPNLVFWGETGGLVITIVALIFLIKPLNILGAGIASLLGYTGTFLSLLYQINRFTSLSPVSLFSISKEDIGCFLRRGGSLQSLWKKQKFQDLN